MESELPCDTSSISTKPKTSDLLNLSNYQKVHPFVKTLFKETRETFPLSGRLKYFLKNWEKVTNNSTILSIVKGYSIDFVETPYQPRTAIKAKLNQVEEKPVLQEVKEMMEKDAIRQEIHCKDQFVSHLFLVSKKDGGQRPVIDVKELNTFIPYKHFKMEGLHLLKEILEQCDYPYKLDLKDAYFCFPLDKQSRK